jgi:UDP-N-acetylglucosamine 4,6-dehydratase
MGIQIDKNATYLITGGTGSFGSTMVKKLVELGVKDIRVFSRDENKQDNLRNLLNTEQVSYHIGDVRDIDSLKKPMKNVEYIFHAAALKQVPSCEFFPEEAVKTNVLGSKNVMDLACEYGVRKVVFLSTDKAVYPINAMGMTKALMEKHVFANARNRENTETKMMVTRYGNVMFSRGSVIPLFIQQLKKNSKITLTDKAMTRFLLTLEDSVSLVKYAFAHGESGDLFIKKAPGATVKIISEAIAKILGIDSYDEEIIGIRHGEKMHESLLTREELSKAIDLEGYYKVSIDDRSLQYRKYFSEGNPNIIGGGDYTSENTYRLNLSETIDLIANTVEMRDHLIL